MSQNNLLQGYSWDSQCEDAQTEFSRPIQDEVISVYEVYVKEEETSGSDGRSENSAVSGNSGSNTSTSGNYPSNSSEHRLIQGDCMELDAAIDSEIINVDDSVAKLIGKEALKYKMLEQSLGAEDDDVEEFPNQTVSELQHGNPSSGPRHVDKDDPRSRLHFVKYLKRDGKTLKIWECGICTKEFRHQYTLMRHLPTHTDERNFKCDACGKAFRQLSTLSQHKAIHSDARPYVCEFCKKTFNRVSTLISHRKTHSEQKPHKCHVCGKGFHQKGNLRNHVFTHTNERPYKCELCGKGFNQMSNLVCHKVKAHAHSEKMQYSCGICGMEFPRRFALRSHEEYKHGIKYRNPNGIQNEANASENSTATCTSAAASNTSSNGSTTPSRNATATITGPNIMRNKNVRVVEMPNGERNQEIEIRSNQTEYTDGIVIDKIDTKALENAIAEGQMPFALLKPVKGIPVLVKVSPAGFTKHLLTPATADDLRMVGKMTSSPTITADSDGNKAIQVKVPVVATITQHVDKDGKQSFSVEAPGPDQDQESLVAPLDCNFPFQDNESSLRLDISSGSLFDRNTTDSNTLPLTNPQPDDCSELLELAAQGGIQFVRATEDGRYEVMTNSEARDLMAQNSHDVTILDGDDADALNIVNTRGQSMTVHEDSTIVNTDSQMMLVDPFATEQKPINLEGIEILDDKDIKIIDPKNIDERMLDGMTFLSQMKIDDMILVPGKSSSGIETALGCPIAIGSPPNNHDFPTILSNRNDLTGFVNNSQSMNMTSLLTKSQQQQHQQSSLSILNDTINYLRNCPPRSLSDEFNMLNDENELITADLDERQLQQQGISCYGGKMKFNEFDDTIEDASNLLGIGPQEGKFLGQQQQQNHKIMGHQRGQNCQRIADYYRGNESRNYWDNERNLPSFGEVKILGPKNSDLSDNGSMEFQDIRILGSYEQFLKSSATFGHQQYAKTNNCTIDEGQQSTRKQVKILGKKLEMGFVESNEDGTTVKIEDDNDACRKMVTMSPRDPCTSASMKYAAVSLSPEVTKHHSLPKGSDEFLIETCSPDFLNSQKSQRDNATTERMDFDGETRKERDLCMQSLPNLD